jgi:2-oxoglutarate ferredoxin oxidoreductase subunit alpha
MPTKTEQADLFQALYGRHGESPVAVLAPATPADCFEVAFEAVRIATTHMVPVLLLSDGYLANGSEPWLLPDTKKLPAIKTTFHTKVEGFQPYLRDPKTLARPWAKPGTPGLEHRIGGIEKEDGSGNVSYDPENHEHMVRVRERKVELIANDVAPPELLGADSGDLLILGWGSSYGAITSAVRSLLEEGVAVSQLHLRWLNPLSPVIGDILGRFKKVLIPEMNRGQLASIIRAKYLVVAISYSKVQGQPFKRREIVAKAHEVLKQS